MTNRRFRLVKLDNRRKPLTIDALTNNQALDGIWLRHAVRAAVFGSTTEGLCPLVPHFAHERHNVALRIAELRQPKVMVGHPGDHMRLAFCLHTAFD
jgi:hypothetical protein